MPTPQEIVHGLSDSQVAEVAKELFNAVYSQVSYEDVRSNSEDVEEVAPLLSLDKEALEHDLSAAESASFGRLMLKQYAQHSELETFVLQACEKVRSPDHLFVAVGTILAVGLVVNLTLLVATTELHVEKGADGKTTWRLVKKQVSPELMKEVVKPVTQAVMATTA